jgi:8-oxo-(d)GTP phosphatase
MAKEKPKIFAAGVVLVKKTKVGRKVAVIHRSHREDWTLPKGHIEIDEIPQLAAVRELFEETGLTCELTHPLPSRTYYKENDLKKVYYWKARLVGEDTFAENDEVDELTWSSKTQLKNILTYEDDAELAVSALEELETTPLILLRHAQAEKRVDWSDRYLKKPPIDTVRPLTKIGFSQISEISRVLHAYGIKKVISSDASRCISTITQFATEINQPINAYQSLNELGWQANPSPALELIMDALNNPTPQVICGHRPALPEIASFIQSQVESVDLDAALVPGAMLVLHRTINKGTISIKHAEIVNI